MRRLILLSMIFGARTPVFAKAVDLSKVTRYCENAEKMAEFAVVSVPQSSRIPDQVLISKSKNLLFLLADGEVVGRYYVALGNSPYGHKEKEGDGRTPEGMYSIQYHHAKSKYYKALKISYPNAEDIRKAKEAGVDPGGDIMIHGLPNEPYKNAIVSLVHGKANWTTGCMAMTNQEIDEVYSRVKDDTPVEICAAPLASRAPVATDDEDTSSSEENKSQIDW